MANLLLSLGSNLGTSTDYLVAARTQLQLRLGTIVYASPVLRTAAWGKTDQPDFHNQVLVLALPDLALRGPGITPTLHQLLTATQAIEADLGRRRDQPWGPRTLDIDLLAVDDLRHEDPRLSLPHPWWRVRPFVTELLPPPGLYGNFGILDQR